MYVARCLRPLAPPPPPPYHAPPTPHPHASVSLSTEVRFSPLSVADCTGGGYGGLPLLLYVQGNRRLIRDGEPRTSTSTVSHGSQALTAALFSVALRPQNHRIIRDGEPRTTTSTFTQLLSSTEPRCLTVYMHIRSRVVGAMLY